MEELYVLQDDPYELKNLIDDVDSVDVFEEMKQELQRLLKLGLPGNNARFDFG